MHGQVWSLFVCLFVSHKKPLCPDRISQEHRHYIHSASVILYNKAMELTKRELISSVMQLEAI